MSAYDPARVRRTGRSIEPRTQPEPIPWTVHAATALAWLAFGAIVWRSTVGTLL